jgi:hypothetical protein
MIDRFERRPSQWIEFSGATRSLLAGRLAREARGAIETHGSVEFALQIAVAGVHDYRDADAIGQRT